MSKEAMKLALEALESYKSFIDDAHILEGQWHWIDGADNAQAALREALAEQPAQEPVAWLSEGGNFSFEPWQRSIPLYTSPPAQRTWEEWFKWWRTSKVSDSTEAEIDFADFMLIVRAVESEYGIKGNT